MILNRHFSVVIRLHTFHVPKVCSAVEILYNNPSFDSRVYLVLLVRVEHEVKFNALVYSVIV
jgi:hypothetical protein